jgi:hypothetical protein
MLFTILCCKLAGDVETWTKEKEDRVMAAIAEVEHKLAKAGKLGPVARLMPPKTARTLRTIQGAVTDGPFAETKEHLLGFYIIDVTGEEEAIEVAKEIGRANPGGSYEIRPMLLFREKPVVA